MLFTKDNGNSENDTDEANKYGLMVLNMKAIGKTIWQMVKGD